MALLKRFDTLEVATTDLADAVKTYRENFGFELTPGSSGDSATLASNLEKDVAEKKRLLGALGLLR